MERADVEELLRSGLRHLLVEDYELFLGRANERAITSLLAGYLAGDPRVPEGLSIDHEYNRLGLGYTKNLKVWIKGELQVDADGNPIEKQRVPDILIHGRGDNEDNLVALEVKVDSMNDDGDKSKIWALTSEPIAYEFGVLLSLHRSEAHGRPEWTPLWAWNPEPGRTEVDYHPALDDATVAELALRGQETMLDRRKARRRR